MKLTKIKFILELVRKFFVEFFVRVALPRRQAGRRRVPCRPQVTRTAGCRRDRTRNTFREAIFGQVLSSLLLLCDISYSAVPSGEVCFPKGCVKVEVVQKPQDLMRGLQFRKSLAPKSGMLFVFSVSARHSFWMKNTKIPLDMIWMDYARRIVYIKKSVPPCVLPDKEPGQEGNSCPVYVPDQEAMYVLEINSGYSDTLKLQLSDEAAFKINFDHQ